MTEQRTTFTGEKIWDHEKALDIIRKLNAKAENPGVTAEEAKAFRAQALKLAAKYEIDWALAVESGAIKANEKVISIFYTVAKPFIQKMSVLGLIAKHTGCDVIRLNAYKNRVHVFGMSSDISLFRILLASVFTQGEVEFANTVIPAGSVPRTYRRAWWQGFAAGLSTQTITAKREATKESGTPGSAIVLRDKAEAVAEEIGQAYPELRKARRSSVRFTAGQWDGYDAGKKVDLGTGHLSGKEAHQEIDR